MLSFTAKLVVLFGLEWVCSGEREEPLGNAEVFAVCELGCWSEAKKARATAVLETSMTSTCNRVISLSSAERPSGGRQGLMLCHLWELEGGSEVKSSPCEDVEVSLCAFFECDRPGMSQAVEVGSRPGLYPYQSMYTI